MKRFTLIALMSLLILSFKCNKDDDDINIDTPTNETPTNETPTNETPTNETPTNVVLEQFTPDLANWDTFESKPFINNNNSSHAPDDINWINSESWENAKWDGTIYDPTKMTKAEFHKALFPHSDILRGIREVYYETNPFKDPKNPTKAEVDEWHRISINHLRALVGYTSEDRKVKKDHCMFKRALWGQERRFTTMWDTKYSGTNGSSYGPCQGSGNDHCGSSFIPDEEDQKRYLPNQTICGVDIGAEGVTGAPKSDIVWSVKWIRAISDFIENEGFWGGHVGPFFHREKFGFSFWDNGINDNNSNCTLRAKWTGNLMPNMYEGGSHLKK